MEVEGFVNENKGKADRKDVPTGTVDT